MYLLLYQKPEILKIEIIHQYGKYLFLLRAGNGRILLRSIKFDSLQSCLEKATLLKTEGTDGSRFERKKIGQRLQLTYKDINGSLLATGTLYSTPLTYTQGLRTITSMISELPIYTPEISAIK